MKNQIYDLGKEQGFGAVFKQIANAVGGEWVSKYNNIQSDFVNKNIDENTYDYRMGILSGEAAYFIATTVPEPEKLSLNPKLVNVLGKISKVKDFEMPEMVVTAERVKKTEVIGEARKYWTQATEYSGIKVYQRNDLINATLVDGQGRTNLQRMEQGLAPIGPDGNPINLHHMTQTNDSAIAEVTQSFHQENTKAIHINPNTIPPGIDRSEFNKWKSNYWKNRANDFKK